MKVECIDLMQIDNEELGARIAKVVNPDGGSACESLFYPDVVYPVRSGMKLFREEQCLRAGHKGDLAEGEELGSNLLREGQRPPRVLAGKVPCMSVLIASYDRISGY